MSKLNLDESNVCFKVVDIEIAQSTYSGADSEFKKKEVLDWDELMDRIKAGSETINGYCDIMIDEYRNTITLGFVGMNPDDEEFADGDEYIDDCYITLEVGVCNGALSEIGDFITDNL